MNIALIADDGKKELMVQFCIAYCGILAKHDLSSTFTTGRLISEATGLKVRTYLHSAQGCQQLDARISYNEIDLVLFFCDAESGHFDEVNRMARLCDQRQIPFATNEPTAELHIQGQNRGDLHRRAAAHSSPAGDRGDLRGFDSGNHHQHRPFNRDRNVG